MNPNDLPQPEMIIAPDLLTQRVFEMGRQIEYDLGQTWDTLIAVANGAIPFAADLLKVIRHPIRFDTISVHSYEGTESQGELTLRSQLKLDVQGRTILLVDDILDSGRTMSHLTDHLIKKGALRVVSCVLLDKPERRCIPFQADYVGFTIPDYFVVGYGLDFNEYYRNLPYLGKLN